MTDEFTQTTNLSPSTPEPGSTLIERFRQWAAPPIFPDDEEKTRLASLANSICLGGILVFSLYGIAIPWSTPNVLQASISVIVMLGFLFIGLRAIRNGIVSRAAQILLISGWVVAAVTSASFGGVNSPIFISFVILILIAGILLNTRTAFIVTIASVVYGAILILFENAGFLTAYSGTTTSFFTRVSFSFITVTYLIFLSNRDTERLHATVSNARQELEEGHFELDEIRTYLQEEVEKNTQQLERRNRYLEAAAQIARDSITAFDQQEMLNQVVGLLATQFGYYQVGIFLIDEEDEWAYLRAASSEGGQAMVARNHRLGVGKQGIVGFVTGIGQPRITQDIDLDRIHSVTPELPETRSEMALPLKARGEIIGALDIQDSRPHAFLEEDISTLQTLADQISLAIENLRLYQEVEHHKDAIQYERADSGQRTWVGAHRQKAVTGYRYTAGKLVQVSDTSETIISQNKLEIPIVVRGRRIGSIEIAKGGFGSQWTEDEEHVLSTLSEQLGVALDSARLFNETQLRASTEKMIGDINSEIWESLEINSILRTTVEKLQKSLALPEVSIKMTNPAVSEEITRSGNPQDTSNSN